MEADGRIQRRQRTPPSGDGPKPAPGGR
jgi:hypothetical protein